MRALSGTMVTSRAFIQISGKENLTITETEMKIGWLWTIGKEPMTGDLVMKPSQMT